MSARSIFARHSEETFFNRSILSLLPTMNPPPHLLCFHRQCLQGLVLCCGWGRRWLAFTGGAYKAAVLYDYYVHSSLEFANGGRERVGLYCSRALRGMGPQAAAVTRDVTQVLMTVCRGPAPS